MHAETSFKETHVIVKKCELRHCMCMVFQEMESPDIPVAHVISLGPKVQDDECENAMKSIRELMETAYQKSKDKIVFFRKWKQFWSCISLLLFFTGNLCIGFSFIHAGFGFLFLDIVVHHWTETMVRHNIKNHCACARALSRLMKQYDDDRCMDRTGSSSNSLVRRRAYHPLPTKHQTYHYALHNTRSSHDGNRHQARLASGVLCHAQWW